jgi:hypothetical protein
MDFVKIVGVMFAARRQQPRAPRWRAGFRAGDA